MASQCALEAALNRCLVLEVELVERALADLGKHGARIERRERRGQRRQQPLEQSQVLANRRVETRAAQLDRDRLALAHAAVNLRGRGHRDRLELELVELVGQPRPPGVPKRALDAARSDRLGRGGGGGVQLGRDLVAPRSRQPDGVDRSSDPRQRDLPARR